MIISRLFQAAILLYVFFLSKRARLPHVINTRPYVKMKRRGHSKINCLFRPAQVGYNMKPFVKAHFTPKTAKKQAKTHCFACFFLLAAFFTAHHEFRGEKYYNPFIRNIPSAFKATVYRVMLFRGSTLRNPRRTRDRNPDAPLRVLPELPASAPASAYCTPLPLSPRTAQAK